MKKAHIALGVTRIRPAIFMAIMLAAIMTRPADASAVYQLDVNYTQGSITSGPLSFGLSELPASVSATFMLGAGTVGLNSIDFGFTDVVSADVTFGDATWTKNLLDTFSMVSTSSGDVNSLNYAFSPITTQYSDEIIILNFPLSITGTDDMSGQLFEYGYTASTQTVSAVVVPALSCAGFGAPLDGDAVTVKKNRVLPLKAQLIDEEGQPVDDLGIPAAPVLTVSFDDHVGPAEDVSDDALSAGAGTDGNQFEFIDTQWRYNLKAKNYSASGTYTVTMESGNSDEYVIDPQCSAEFVIN
jgi:hypothetical protein